MRLALLAAAVAAAALVSPDDVEARERRGGERSKSRSHVSTHVGAAAATNRALPLPAPRRQSRASSVAYGGGIACTPSTPPGTPGCTLAKVGRRY
jgi:hypothetical protein